MEGKDKTLIWDDCPQCALKHLTAAYAALTSEPITDEGRDYVDSEDILIARHHITYAEYKAGYTGNLALAIGCLALAEVESVDKADVYRDWRLAIIEDRPAVMLGAVPSLRAMAVAHLTEAVRELPCIAERFSGWSNGSFYIGDGVDLLDALKLSIKWVMDTYELWPKGDHDQEAPKA